MTLVSDLGNEMSVLPSSETGVTEKDWTAYTSCFLWEQEVQLWSLEGRSASLHMEYCYRLNYVLHSPSPKMVKS